jgi:hypothetical protein
MAALSLCGISVNGRAKQSLAGAAAERQAGEHACTNVTVSAPSEHGLGDGDLRRGRCCHYASPRLALLYIFSKYKNI